MKKILILSLLITTSAFAAVIDANTKIKWNAIVVNAAVNDVPFLGGTLATYYSNPIGAMILYDLLQRDKFSVAEAVSACMKHCKSREQEDEEVGCPNACEAFGNALITENNKGVSSLLAPNLYDDDGHVYYNSLGKVYDKDKKFYAKSNNNFYTYGSITCPWTVYEAATDKKVAECFSYDESHVETYGHFEWHMYFVPTDQKYNSYHFLLECYEDNDGCFLEIDNSPSASTSLYKDLYYKTNMCIERKLPETSSNTLSYPDMQLWISSGILTSEGRSALTKQYSFKELVEKSVADFSKFTPTSYELQGELRVLYDKYCSPQGSITKMREELTYEDSSVYAGVAYDISFLKERFKNDFDKFSKETANPLEAQQKVYEWISEYGAYGHGWNYIDTTTLNCVPKCGSSFVGDGYVTCTFGPLKGIFKFNNIICGN